jgi:acetyltransferase-like isoleucine patch superfamily enzyme
VFVRGGGSIVVGDDVRIEAFASLSASKGGRLEIGSMCEIRGFALVEGDTGELVIGDRSSVNPFCLLNGYGGLRIGKNVRIASHAVLLSSSHHIADPATPIVEQGIEGRSTLIEDDVWIGSHAIILGGSRVGAGSVIGAGSIVTGAIPPGVVAVGAPAKVIRSRLE